MTENESSAVVVEPAPGAPALVGGTSSPADDDVFDADIDDTLPPFRPAPEPDGAWHKRWALGIGGWALVVAAAYATVGGHLNPYLSLTGLLVGFLVGLTGMGGGALMTPILILFFGFDAKVAVGTDLLHGAVFKSFGAAQHRMLGTVHARLALWMLLGSAPLSLVGIQVANSMSSTDELQRIVGIALIIGGTGFLLKTYIHGHPSDAPFILGRRDKLVAVAIGASCGFVVGLTSVGSGTFFGLAMLFLYPLTAYKMVGTDMFHAAMLLWIAGVASLIHGNVDTHAMAWLLVGSIPGVLIGSHLGIRVPERGLRVAFGAVLILSGIKVAQVPQAPIVISVSFGLGVLALVVWGIRRLLERRMTAQGRA